MLGALIARSSDCCSRAAAYGSAFVRRRRVGPSPARSSQGIVGSRSPRSHRRRVISAAARLRTGVGRLRRSVRRISERRSRRLAHLPFFLARHFTANGSPAVPAPGRYGGAAGCGASKPVGRDNPWGHSTLEDRSGKEGKSRGGLRMVGYGRRWAGNSGELRIKS